MKIGLLLAFAGRGCGAPEVVEREIVRAMSAIAPQHEYHLFCLDRRAPEVLDLPEGQVIYHLLRPSARVASMLTTLPLAISRSRPEVFHAPMVPPAFCPKNAIMQLPCSSLIRHPEFFPPLIRLRLRFLFHRAIPKAAKIICPSEHVRDVVLERFKLPADRVPVIYPGVSRSFHPSNGNGNGTQILERHGIQFPYFLFSGRWEHRKNILRTLEAFALFKQTSRTEHKLVLTGERTWAANEAIEVIRRLDLKDAILDLGKSSFDELPHLYRAADAVVYASLWEGFGMPIAEAMACGTPVITSNVSAMPETAGGAALLVNPYSVEEIANAMRRIATEPDLRKHLREKGLKRARRFDWEQTAKETLDVYEEVAGCKAYALAAR